MNWNVEISDDPFEAKLRTEGFMIKADYNEQFDHWDVEIADGYLSISGSHKTKAEVWKSIGTHLGIIELAAADIDLYDEPISEYMERQREESDDGE